jgi:hypothetical protein
MRMRLLSVNGNWEKAALDHPISAVRLLPKRSEPQHADEQEFPFPLDAQDCLTSLQLLQPTNEYRVVRQGSLSDHARLRPLYQGFSRLGLRKPSLL